MNSTQLSQPPQLNLKTATDVSKNWKKVKQAWQIYEIAAGVREKTEEVRLAIFLGPDAVEKYSSFLFESQGDRVNLERVIEKFGKDCKNVCNVLAERNTFFCREQQKNECYDQYITDLRILCSSCEFSNPEEALRDQFALNINNDRAKEKLLTEAQHNHKSLTFDKAVAIVKGNEALKIKKTEDLPIEMEVDAMKITTFF